MPWHNFLKWVNALSPAISIITPVSTHLDQARAGMPHDSHTAPTTGILSMSPIDAVLSTSDLDIARPAQSLRGLSSFLPLNTQDRQHYHHNTTVDLAGVNSLLETLKLLVTVVSNNYDTIDLRNFLVWLSENKQVHGFFARMLRQDLRSMKACSEGLWIPAVINGNRSIVKLLIDSGVDVNMRRYVWGRNCLSTALECAVEKSNNDIVDLLLEHGANDWYTAKPDRTFTERSDVTIFNLVVEKRDIRMLERLLDSELQIVGSHQSASLRTLRLAILTDQLDMVTLLVDRRPELWRSGKDDPIYLLEAAATCEGCVMFNALYQMGLADPGDLGNGNPLVVASANSNKNLVQHLLATGADVLQLGRGLDFENGQIYYSERRLSMVTANAALHMAAGKGNTEIVRILLDHGADPLQYCGAYPVELAAAFGSQSTINLLIARGAFIDAVAPDGFPIRSTTDSAICKAFYSGCIDIVQILHRAGARMPPADQTRIRHDCNWRPCDCFLIDHEADNMDGTLAEDHWDPWLFAVLGSADKLIHIVRGNLIGYSMPIAHLARCIMIHGADFAQTIVPDVFENSPAASNPLVLCALVYVRDDVKTRRLTSQLLATFGHDVFSQHYGIKALNSAVIYRHEKLVRFFVDLGVDPFWPEPGLQHINLWRADRWVCLHGYPFHKYRSAIYDLVPIEWLLDPICSTPFQAACLSGDMGMVGDLVEWHISHAPSSAAPLRNRSLSAALISAVTVGSEELEAKMMGYVVSLENAIYTMGRDYFDEQLRYGLQGEKGRHRSRVVTRLLDLGADPHVPVVGQMSFDDWCESPLRQAVEDDDANVVGRLIDLGVDVNARLPLADSNSMTAVQIAAVKGNFEILDLLLKAGGDINAPPCVDGRSALEGAAEHGRLDMTSHLLSLGVDIQGHSNKNYRRSIYRAWKEGHRVLANMIQDWKRDHYGEDDVDTIDNIMASVTEDEVKF
jgi:ankyrin repeat protein